MNVDPVTLRVLIIAGAFVASLAIWRGKTMWLRSKDQEFHVGDKAK